MTVAPKGRKTDAQKQGEKRAAAMATLTRFSAWLKLGTGVSVRGALSPARALTYLKDQDVKDLLGPEKVAEIRSAAELLS